MANIANLAPFVTLTLFASNYYSSFYCLFYLSLPLRPPRVRGWRPREKELDHSLLVETYGISDDSYEDCLKTKHAWIFLCTYLLLYRPQ